MRFFYLFIYYYFFNLFILMKALLILCYENQQISKESVIFFPGVYLLSSPSGNLAYGTISRFTITATDKGTPALTGTTYVDIIYRETTTTTTTTTAAPSTYNFWDDSGAVAAFSIAMILGKSTFLCIIYLIRYIRWSYRLQYTGLKRILGREFAPTFAESNSWRSGLLSCPGIV
jgi:hypothetical protein